MAIPWQVSRPGAFWLLLAFVLCTVPLLRYLPLWLPVVPAVALVWRLGIYRGRWGAPGRWLKLVLTGGCVAGLAFSFPRFSGLEPMMSLLICAFSLKLLEMYQRRDALVVVFLAYFVAIALALFDQGALTALYIVLAILIVTASLAGVHHSGTVTCYRRPLVKSLYILAQAIPLMVIFFLVMPRLGPLWGVPSPSSGITGMSDSLVLGDITRLGSSSAIAFRAEFADEMPPRDQLYWRGVTLSRFDGRRWSRVDWRGQAVSTIPWQEETSARWNKNVITGSRAPIDYRIILEKTGGDWLYSLWYPQPLSENVGVLRDVTLKSRQPLTRRMEYWVRSYPDVRVDETGLTDERRAVEMSLPRDSNPRTRQLAAQWARETPDAQVLVKRILAYYQESFFYTLTPPALGEHSVDDFLFRSQAGFCEHFAASFVFFMRAAGVPARIVAGYQGGEVHPQEGYLIVRQYDAHAWAEIWLEGQGWVRVDPTAAVAPQRVLSSLLDLMSADVVFANSPLDLVRFQNIAWVNRLRLQMEAFEYSWARWVLGYNSLQGDFLKRLLGGQDVYRLAAFLLIGSLLSLVPVLFVLYRGREEKPHPADSIYRIFCQRLARAGCQRMTGEAPQAFCHRSAAKFPANAVAISEITACYVALRYSPGGGDLARFRKRVRAFRVKR